VSSGLGLLVGAAALAIWSVVFLEGRLRLNRHVGETEEGAEESWAAVRWIIVLAWAYGALPSLVGLWQLGRQGNGIGTLTVVTSAQARLATALSTVIAFLCFRLIVVHIRSAPSAGIWRLSVFLAPWVGIEVIAAIAAGYSSGRQFLLYPVIAVAFWLASPPLRVVSTLGVLAVVTAAFSLIFALVSPLALVNAGPAGSDKAIISHGPLLLAGPYDASNGLALSLALGSACVVLLRSARIRVLSFALIGAALLWSAGRTSILAGAVVLAVYSLSRGRSVQTLKRLGMAAVVAGTALVVWTPFHETNPLAFSRRGMIWIASLSLWHHHLWFGAGPEFYERPNDLGFYALYGHNLVVDTLARGGLVALAGVAIWVVMLLRQSLRLSSISPFPILFVVAFVYTSWLEVPVAFNNLGILGYVCWLPLAVIAFTRDERPLEDGLRSPALV
jgi:hypothetical protein